MQAGLEKATINIAIKNLKNVLAVLNGLEFVSDSLNDPNK